MSTWGLITAAANVRTRPFLHAFQPRVVVMNNGLKKGGAKNTYETLHHVAGLADVWQIHRSEAAGEQNLRRLASRTSMKARVTGSSSAPTPMARSKW